MKVVVTGGHHSSALPVVKKLMSEGNEIVWFGHKHTLKGNKNTSLEYREITALGIPFFNLRAGKFYKTYNLAMLAKIPYGFFQALSLLIKEKPDVILSFGGYLAVPTVVAGRLLGIHSVTHEQTLVVGYANKLLARFVDKVLISWESSRKFFPKNKVVFSGLPLREEIFHPKDRLPYFGNDLPTVYITGGKTGSKKINDTVANCLPNLLNICNVIHQCGDYSETDDYSKLLDVYLGIETKPAGRYYLKKFLFDNEIGDAYNNASIVISRAGAHTIAEIYALNKPSILIPIPWVSHNEQMKNAEFIRDKGLGTILEENDLTPDTLFNTVSKIFGNIENYKLNVPFERVNSVEIIIDELKNTAKRKTS